MREEMDPRETFRQQFIKSEAEWRLCYCNDKDYDRASDEELDFLDEQRQLEEDEERRQDEILAQQELEDFERADEWYGYYDSVEYDMYGGYDEY